MPIYATAEPSAWPTGTLAGGDQRVPETAGGRSPEYFGEFLSRCVYYRSRRLDDAVKALDATLAASKD